MTYILFNADANKAQQHELAEQIAADLGLTAECAAEMVAEHIARRDQILPRYVRLGLNRASSTGGSAFVIHCAKTHRFLDRLLGFNADNVHTVGGFTVNRNKVTGAWYVV